MTLLSRLLLVLALFAFAPTAEAYTYVSPLTSSNASTASAQRCTGSQVAAIGTASGTGASPSTDSIAWALLGSYYSGGLPSNYNTGSYCIQAALTVTTSGGGGGGGRGGGGDGNEVFTRPAGFFAFFGIEEAWAQTSSWSIAYTVHSGTGKSALADTYALTYTPVSPAPTATLNTPSPSTISQGSSSALTWSSTNATSCTGSNFSTGGATSGTVSVSPSTSTTYSVTCTGAGGTSAPSSRTVTVVANPPAAPTATLTASPTNPAGGQSVTLTWSSTNAISCTSTQFDTQGATSGSVVVTPSGSTTYNITCSGSGATGPGTWQYVGSDTTDLACPWTDPNRPYASMPHCGGNPTGTSCTNPPDNRCKINSGSCNAVNTDIYACTVSGPPPSVSDDAVVTMTGIGATLSADQLSVAPGGTVTLTWTSNGAQTCIAQEIPLIDSKPTADYFNNTSQATFGSDVVRVNEDTQFGIYCYGPTYGGGGGGGGGGGSCSPQYATYNPTCNVNYEPIDITCSTGYSVQFEDIMCIHGRNQGDNNRDFKQRASCVPCEAGSSGGDGSGGSGNDWAYDTVDISVNEPACGDNADNDGDGLIDASDPSCVSCTGPTCVEEPLNPAATISCTVDSSSVTIGGQTTYRTGGTAVAPFTWTPSSQTNCSGTSTRTCTFPASGPYSMSVQGSGVGSPVISCPNVSASGCAGSPSASLTVNGVADRIRVKDNSAATIGWTFQNISAGNCSLTGTDGLSQTLVPNACGQTVSSVSRTIRTQVIYTLSCPGTSNDTVLVNVDSGSGEF